MHMFGVDSHAQASLPLRVEPCQGRGSGSWVRSSTSCRRWCTTWASNPRRATTWRTCAMPPMASGDTLMTPPSARYGTRSLLRFCSCFVRSVSPGRRDPELIHACLFGVVVISVTAPPWKNPMHARRPTSYFTCAKRQSESNQNERADSDATHSSHIATPHDVIANEPMPITTVTEKMEIQ